MMAKKVWELFGVTLKERQQVKRNASEIYWNGLQTYRFLENRRSVSTAIFKEFFSTSNFRTFCNNEEKDDLMEIEGLEKIKTPLTIIGFKNLQLGLTEDEQGFFKSQILQPSNFKAYSLLVELMKNEELSKCIY